MSFRLFHQVFRAIKYPTTPRKGRFAIANRIPSPLNPTKHFTEPQNRREVFCHLIQCRTGHARVHRRIREAVLPREKRRLRVRGRPADMRAHHKDMRPLRNPAKETPKGAPRARPLCIHQRFRHLHIHRRIVHPQRPPHFLRGAGTS